MEHTFQTGRRLRRFRNWTVGALVATLVAALGYWLFSGSDGPQPVMAATLETNPLEKLAGRGAWRDPGFRLPPHHIDAMKACAVLAQMLRSKVNGACPFATDGVRDSLRQIVREAPDCFYAEYLLGLWHQMNDNPAEAETHYGNALAHAPVVLVQRFELGDGRPAAGVEAPELEIECNRVEGDSLDPSLKLTFFKLTTDADGCVRLPVYKTVYRLTSAASPVGFDSHWPTTGWFQSRGRIGALPAAVLTSKP